jgi:hypothetical protein
MAVVLWYFIWKMRKRKRSQENIDVIHTGGTPMLEGFPESHSLVHNLYSPQRDLSPLSGWNQNRGPQRLSSAFSATSSGSQRPPSSSPSGFVPSTDEKAGFSQPNVNMLPTPFPYSPTRDQYLSPLQYAPANTPPLLATSSQTSFTPPRTTQTTPTTFSSPPSRASPMTPYASSSHAPQSLPASSSASSASPQTLQPSAKTEPVTFSSLGPYQHQDAGRVIPPEELVPHPDEIPPAYMDGWNSGS